MKHISHTTTLHVNTSPGDALPLFTAKGEVLWVAGWEPTYIYPQSGETEVNSVWTMQIDNSTREVWVTADYNPVHGSASYIKWTPDKHVTRVDIQCVPDGNGETNTVVTYTLTAFNEAGYPDIERLTKERFEGWIASWEKAINHYLEFDELFQPDHVI